MVQQIPSVPQLRYAVVPVYGEGLIRESLEPLIQV